MSLFPQYLSFVLTFDETTTTSNTFFINTKFLVMVHIFNFMLATMLQAGIGAITCSYDKKDERFTQTKIDNLCLQKNLWIHAEESDPKNGLIIKINYKYIRYTYFLRYTTIFSCEY
jgi:hypothetical protein